MSRGDRRAKGDASKVELARLPRQHTSMSRCS